MGLFLIIFVPQLPWHKGTDNLILILGRNLPKISKVNHKNGRMRDRNCLQTPQSLSLKIRNCILIIN